MSEWAEWDGGAIRDLFPDETQAKHGATVGELINEQSGGRGIFCVGRVSARLNWRTPYVLARPGARWTTSMDCKVRDLIWDINSGSDAMLTRPEDGK
jgi:hypothetical protein